MGVLAVVKRRRGQEEVVDVSEETAALPSLLSFFFEVNVHHSTVQLLKKDFITIGRIELEIMFVEYIQTAYLDLCVKWSHNNPQQKT